MGTGTAATDLTAADLRPWALVYDPAVRRMYEVLEVEDSKIAVLLDATEDYDPESPVNNVGSRRVAVKWATEHLALVRKAPDFTPPDPAVLPSVAGSFKR